MSIYLKSLLFLITCAIALIYAGKDFFGATTVQLRKKGIYIILLLLLSLGVSIADYIVSENQQESKAKDLQNKIETLQTTLRKSDSLSQIRIKALQDDNFNLSRELSGRTLNTILGSDEVKIEIRRYGFDNFKFVLKNLSQFPIYDCKIKIQDADGILDCEKKGFMTYDDLINIDKDCFFFHTKDFVVGTIHPHSESIIPWRYSASIRSQQSKYRNFSFEIATRRGFIIRNCVYELIPFGKRMNERYKIRESIKNTIFLGDKKKITIINPLKLDKNYWRTIFLEGKIIQTVRIVNKYSDSTDVKNTY